jgi:hypothetical protein
MRLQRRRCKQLFHPPSSEEKDDAPPALTNISINTLLEPPLLQEEEVLFGIWSSKRKDSTNAACLPYDSRPSNSSSQKTVLFWSSPTAFSLYGLLALWVWTRYSRMVWYAICFVVIRLMGRVLSPWMAYLLDDPDAQRSVRYLRQVWRIFLRETDQILSGNLGRQVVAAYLIHACTAPGESYISYLIRYKMNLLNVQWMEELQHWSEIRLGYRDTTTTAAGTVAASQRNMLA